jgi:hypothetical protein
MSNSSSNTAVVHLRRLLTRLLVAFTAVSALQLVGVPTAWSAPTPRLSLHSTGRGGADALPFAVTHIGLKWTGRSDAVVQYRWRAVAGAWSPWQTAEVNGDLTAGAQGTVYTTVHRVPDATRVETRVVSGQADNVTVAGIDAEHGPRHLVTAPALSPAEASMTNAKVPAPGIVTRAQWGADETLRKGTPEFAPLTKLIVHHTDTDNNDSDPAGTVRAIYVFHTQVRGWNDIGYNFLVDQQGRVYEGRWARAYAPGEVHTGEDLRGNGVIGAHAVGANTGSVGVALLGTYDSVAPPAAQVNGLQATLAWKADRHDIDPAASSTYHRSDGTSIPNLPNVSGHRDSSSTDCPGDVVYGMLPLIRLRTQHIVMAAHGTTPGYWVGTKDGGVLAFGAAGSYGSMSGRHLNAPIVGMAATPTGKGYWLLGGDGGIFSFGDARFFGSTGGARLNAPVVGMAPTPTGNGYWLVAGDGGIFSYGDARFYGSTGSLRLNAPVLGMAATRTGGGYWLYARDGGIFSYGDAAFHGSTGSMRLASPVFGMDANATGGGYWLTARDGGVFAFDTPFWGSVPGLELGSYPGAVAMRATRSGRGYYILAADGSITAFGDAREFGWKALAPGAAVAMSLVPEGTS